MLTAVLTALTALTALTILTVPLSLAAAPALAGGESHWFDEPILFVEAEELLAFDEPILFVEVGEDFDVPLVGISDGMSITIAGEFDSFDIKDPASWRQENTEFCRDGQYDLAPPLVMMISGDLDPMAARDPRMIREAGAFLEAPLVALDMSGVMSGREAFDVPLVGLELGEISHKELAAAWEGAPLAQIAVDPDSASFTNPLVAIGTRGEVVVMSAAELLDAEVGFIEIITGRE